MKLGSLKEGGRDGTLIVVSRDLRHGVRATGIAATLQLALEDWSHLAPRLNALYESLNAGDADGVFDLDPLALAAPMPRAYEFVDGSAYLPHVERVRRARGAEVPESFYTDPLMYQATSAGFYGPRDAVRVVSEDYGIDLEAEVVIVTDDVPMAVTAQDAAVVGGHHRRLRHHSQRGHLEGRFVLRRTTHRGNPARRQAEHAFHEVRRHGAHRDAGRLGRVDLRRHRTAHRTAASRLISARRHMAATEGMGMHCEAAMVDGSGQAAGGGRP